MDVDNLDSSELEGWVAQRLAESNLVGGRAAPVYRVQTAKVPRGWTVVGTATFPPITITSLEAHSHDTLDDFLKIAPPPVALEVDRLFLQDAEIGDGGFATRFEGAHSALTTAAIAVLTPKFAAYEFDIPAWARKPPASPIFTTDALERDELVFFHPVPRALDYLVEAAVEIVRDGPNSRLIIAAVVARSQQTQKARATKFKIV